MDRIDENDFQEVMLRVTIAKNVKELRKKHGLTQEQLAKLAGLSRLTISAIEKFRRTPLLINLLQIAKAMNEPIEAILKGWESTI